MRLRALWWTLAVVGVAMVVALSLMARPPDIPGNTGGWLGHVLAYAVMMGWYARLLPARGARLATALAFCALGVALEFAQRETGYRTFDTRDMLANAAGVALGWGLSPPRVPDGLVQLDRALARWISRAADR